MTSDESEGNFLTEEKKSRYKQLGKKEEAEE